MPADDSGKLARKLEHAARKLEKEVDDGALQYEAMIHSVRAAKRDNANVYLMQWRNRCLRLLGEPYACCFAIERQRQLSEELAAETAKKMAWEVINKAFGWNREKGKQSVDLWDHWKIEHGAALNEYFQEHFDDKLEELAGDALKSEGKVSGSRSVVENKETSLPFPNVPSDMEIKAGSRKKAESPRKWSEGWIKKRYQDLLNEEYRGGNQIKKMRKQLCLDVRESLRGSGLRLLKLLPAHLANPEHHDAEFQDLRKNHPNSVLAYCVAQPVVEDFYDWYNNNWFKKTGKRGGGTVEWSLLITSFLVGKAYKTIVDSVGPLTTRTTQCRGPKRRA